MNYNISNQGLVLVDAFWHQGPKLGNLLINYNGQFFFFNVQPFCTTSIDVVPNSESLDDCRCSLQWLWTSASHACSGAFFELGWFRVASVQSTARWKRIRCVVSPPQFRRILFTSGPRFLLTRLSFEVLNTSLTSFYVCKGSGPQTDTKLSILNY